MRTVFNFTARDRISPSPLPAPFHFTGEEEFRGWDGARFQLSRLKSSAVRARLFNRYLSFTVHDSRNAYECDGPVCIIYRARPDQFSVQGWTELFGCAPPLVPRLLQESSALGFPLKCQRHEIPDQAGSVSRKRPLFSTGSCNNNRIVPPRNLSLILETVHPFLFGGWKEREKKKKTSGTGNIPAIFLFSRYFLSGGQ